MAPPRHSPSTQASEQHLDFVLFGDPQPALLPSLHRSSLPSATLTPAQIQAVDFSTAYAFPARQRSSSTSINPSSVNVNLQSAQHLNNWNTFHPTIHHSRTQVTTRPAVPLFHSNTTGHLQTPNTSFDMNHTMHGSGSDESFDFALLLSEASFDAPTGFTAINNGAPSATVSPQDLFIDHDMSAPNSNALTDLTSPSLYDDTPYDVSPAFETANFGHSDWAPLFSNDDGFSAAESNIVEPPSLTTSLASLNSNVHEMARTPSASDSPMDNSAVDALHRLTSSAGVNKSSRRSMKDLPPIEVDEEDERAVKRARNTLAARKSRQKKRDTEDMLRIALDAMTSERDRWKMLAIRHGAPIPES